MKHILGIIEGIELVLIPLSYSDIQFWFAANAIILLFTSEILSSYSKIFMINKKRLRLAALFFSLVFAISTLIQFYEMIM